MTVILLLLMLPTDNYTYVDLIEVNHVHNSEEWQYTQLIFYVWSYKNSRHEIVGQRTIKSKWYDNKIKEPELDNKKGTYFCIWTEYEYEYVTDEKTCDVKTIEIPILRHVVASYIMTIHSDYNRMDLRYKDGKELYPLRGLFQ